MNISNEDTNKYYNRINKIERFEIESLHFNGIRYLSSDCVVQLVFEAVIEKLIFELDVYAECEPADIEFLRTQCSEWDINTQIVSTDSPSVDKFCMVGTPIMCVDESNTDSPDKFYMVHILSLNNTVEANMIIYQNYYYMIEYIMTSLMMHKNPDRKIINQLYDPIQNIWWDSEEIVDKFELKKIFVTNQIINKYIWLFILLKYKDTNIIFSTRAEAKSLLKKKILKQDIISKDVKLLDSLYEESCNYGKEFNIKGEKYYVTSSDRLSTLDFQTVGDSLVMNNKSIMITEPDDFHELSAIITDAGFLPSLENKVSKIINSKLY